MIGDLERIKNTLKATTWADLRKVMFDGCMKFSEKVKQ